ncbi:unnamed protein product [Arctogadus glacialis]
MKKKDKTCSRAPLTGVMDDCFCDIESIDSFNNIKIYPRAKRLTERDFFRHYRVSTLRPPPTGGASRILRASKARP